MQASLDIICDQIHLFFLPISKNASLAQIWVGGIDRVMPCVLPVSAAAYKEEVGKTRVCACKDIINWPVLSWLVIPFL
jgi:hypothetical protein